MRMDAWFVLVHLIWGQPALRPVPFPPFPLPALDDPQRADAVSFCTRTGHDLSFPGGGGGNGSLGSSA